MKIIGCVMRTQIICQKYSTSVPQKNKVYFAIAFASVTGATLAAARLSRVRTSYGLTNL